MHNLNSPILITFHPISYIEPGNTFVLKCFSGTKFLNIVESSPQALSEIKYLVCSLNANIEST